VRARVLPGVLDEVVAGEEVVPHMQGACGHLIDN
jgi:hypothetical protein